MDELFELLKRGEIRTFVVGHRVLLRECAGAFRDDLLPPCHVECAPDDGTSIATRDCGIRWAPRRPDTRRTRSPARATRRSRRESRLRRAPPACHSAR